LWSATVDEHRREVREAIMETTWSLVAEHGLLSVTMSRIAQEAGIGRATLYKYFPDVEAILTAWHQLRVSAHLAALAAIQEQDGSAGDRLGRVAISYAHICQMRGRHGTPDLGKMLHQGDSVAQAELRLHEVFRDLISEALAAGDVRDDVPVDELAAFCIHALAAAGVVQSEAGLRRLVDLTLDAVAPRH
jgi:AcrR family transcriptional regulator